MRSLRWYRYVWNELAGPSVLGLLLWTFVLLMNAFFLVAEKALSKGLGWELALRMFSYEIPRLLVLSIPMAVLLGALIAVGRLSADHEWVALQGGGYGPSRLLNPLLVWGVGASALAMGIYGVVVPRANYAGRQLFGEVLFVSNLAADLRPGVFYTQLPGTVMFVENIRSSSEGRLEGVFLHRSNPQQDGRDEVILARSGDLVPVPDGSGRLGVRLEHGVHHRYDPADPASYQKWAFDDYYDELPAHQFLQGLRDDPVRSVADMELPELFGELRAARAQLAADDGPGDRSVAESTMRRLRVRTASFELHRRIALPLACLLFAALALPLGVRRARSGKGAGFAVSLLVILLYWIVFTFAMNLARSGEIAPWLGAWSANLVLVPWAAVAYWRLRRSRGEREGVLSRVFGALYRTARFLAPRSTTSRAAQASGEALDDEAAPLADLAGNTRRFIGRLDQYIGRQYLRLVLLTLLAAITIYSVVELKRLVDGALKNDQPISLLLSYFVFAWPGMLNLAVPVACLVGSMVTFTVLTRTGELTAIRAAGISSRRALVPVVVLTTMLCGCLFLVQDQIRLHWGNGQSLVVGWAITRSTNQTAEEIKDRIMGRAPITRGMPAGGQWAFGPDGRQLYHYRLYDPDNGVFQGLSVLTIDRSEPRILDHRFAPLARWSGASWDVEDGWHWKFPENAMASYETGGSETPLALAPPERFSRREAVLSTRQSSTLQEQMSSAELIQQIDDLSASGYDTGRLEVAFWGKLAQSLTPLVMVLLGLSFAFRVGRRGSLYGIGVAILLVIVYWATFAVFNGLGLEAILPPFLAAWTPNILYGMLGAYLILYIPT